MKRLFGIVAASILLVFCIAPLTLSSLSYAAECQSCPSSLSPSPDGNTWTFLGGTPATGCRYGGWYQGNQDFNCARVSWNGTQLVGTAYHYCLQNGTGGEYWGPIGLTCSGETGIGELTPAQLAALQSILDSLQILQSANSTALNQQALINALYTSLASLQNSLGNTLILSQQAATTITGSLTALIGYLGQATLLDQQAKDMIARQIGEITFQQSVIQGNNLKIQGSSMGDPVFVASGIEDLKRVDFKYEAFAETIKIQRRYRSNKRDQSSSFGKGWFFNYDTNIITGRKPYIDARELLTEELDI